MSGGHSYIHHVRGRLRVRSALIKGNEQRAGSARTWLRSLPGVASADANIVTGSLTMRYDPALTDGWTLLAALKEAGYVGHHVAESARPAVRAANPKASFGSELAAKVAKTVALYAAEQAVVALVGALL